LVSCSSYCSIHCSGGGLPGAGGAGSWLEKWFLFGGQVVRHKLSPQADPYRGNNRRNSHQRWLGLRADSFISLFKFSSHVWWVWGGWLWLWIWLVFMPIIRAHGIPLSRVIRRFAIFAYRHLRPNRRLFLSLGFRFRFGYSTQPQPQPRPQKTEPSFIVASEKLDSYQWHTSTFIQIHISPRPHVQFMATHIWQI